MAFKQLLIFLFFVVTSKYYFEYSYRRLFLHKHHLEKQKTQLERIFDMMQDAIIVIEKETPQNPDENDTRLLFSNAKAKNIFRSDDLEIIGLPTTKDLLDMRIFLPKEKNDALQSL